MPIRFGLTVFALGLATLTAEPVHAMELKRITVGSTAFQVEIASTPQERSQGLMFRRELPSERGMLFIQQPGPARFWMKNTYIPLDLLYFNADGKLLQIEAAVPPCKTMTCPIYSSKTNAIGFVLEINAGEAQRHGIQSGDRLRLE